MNYISQFIYKLRMWVCKRFISENMAQNMNSELGLRYYYHSSEEKCEIIYKMKSEANRLKTFRYWPCPYVHPTELAKEGFFYFNQRDCVQCIFCYLIVGQWESTDTVKGEHKRFSPKCPQVLGSYVNNIPLHRSSSFPRGPLIINQESERNIYRNAVVDSDAAGADLNKIEDDDGYTIIQIEKSIIV